MVQCVVLYKVLDCGWDFKVFQLTDIIAISTQNLISFHSFNYVLDDSDGKKS